MRRILTALAALLIIGGAALAQSAPKKYLSTASTNSTLVLGRSSLLSSVTVVNTAAAVYYLKFYNKATAPTCGTDVPVLTIPVPFGASNAGGGVSMSVPDGMMFSNGIGFCITGGIADNDTTVAATGVAVNLGVSGR